MLELIALLEGASPVQCISGRKTRVLGGIGCNVLRRYGFVEKCRFQPPPKWKFLNMSDGGGEVS